MKEMPEYTYFHGVSAGRLFASVAFGKSPVQRVGERVLLQVAEYLLFNLESGVVCYLQSVCAQWPLVRIIRTRCSNGFRGEGLDNGWLVAGGVDELVVHDLDRLVLGWQERNLVCNSLSVAESGHILSDTREAQHDGLSVRTTELGLCLFSNDDKIEIGMVGKDLASSTGHARMNTTTETLVRGADDEKRVLALTLLHLCLGLLENSLRGLSVCAGFSHGTLGAGELGGSDNFHGLCDLLDVADRLEAALDFSEGSIVGRVGDGDGGWTG